jgi:NTE family protein
VLDAHGLAAAEPLPSPPKKRAAARRTALTMVYGGGGVVGIAYTLGVAEGLAATGFKIRTAPALGTSAGSWTATALALGLTYDDLGALPVPPIPAVRTGVLADIAREVFGERTHPLVAVSVVSLSSGRRRILDGAEFPLADLVAASSAVPGLLPPHRVGGTLYIDGGMWSATSVDAARDADHVIVVAPLAGRVMGPMGLVAGTLLERELGRRKRQHAGTRIDMIRPDRAMARIIGVRPLALFDADRARAVHPLARAQGEIWGERIRADQQDR